MFGVRDPALSEKHQAPVVAERSAEAERRRRLANMQVEAGEDAGSFDAESLLQAATDCRAKPARPTTAAARLRQVP